MHSPFHLLAIIGRQGTRAVAGSIFLGLAVPQLASAAKPLLVPCVVVLLVLSFMRTDVRQLGNVRQALLLGGALVWIMGALPTALGLTVNHLLPPSDNGVMLALVLQGAAPPIMSTPAFAALLGIEPAVSLGIMLLALCVVPFTAPLMVSAFTDGALALDGVDLALRLGGLLAVSTGAGFGLRALLGTGRLSRWNDHLNGINVLVLLVLAVAFMDGVTHRFLADPALVLGIGALACGVTLIAFGATFLLFRRAGAGQDLMLAFAAGNRNLGLLVAATGGLLPDTTWLYVALAQFPIYLLPYLLRPLAARLLRPER